MYSLQLENKLDNRFLVLLVLKLLYAFSGYLFFFCTFFAESQQCDIFIVEELRKIPKKNHNHVPVLVGVFLSEIQQCWRALQILIYDKTNLLYLIKSIYKLKDSHVGRWNIYFKLPLKLEFESVGNL